jgi:hypothetical protein
MRKVRFVPIALVAGLAAGLMAVAAPASAYIETSTSDPVTAAPPVSRPDTSSCTVTLADKFYSNAPDGSQQFYSGTLAPPSDCPGPWAKVVLTQTISVTGRQFDRVSSLKIGNTDVYWGTTEEPGGPTPTTYTFDKDITEYAALLRSPQAYRGGIGNYVTDVYTGNYLQTVRITYYQANRRHPAPATPDVVVGLGDAGLSPGTPTVQQTLSGLPRNITRAYLEVTLEGAGCDEQWFDDVPDSVSATYPDAGLCGHGPYREADIALDGSPVAAVHTFPYIYSGGIVPTLWRPIVAIGTFSLTPETVDITPFVGTLVDGRDHTLTTSIQDIGDGWTAVETLLLYTDHQAQRTHGALLSDRVAPAADVTTQISAVDGGTQAIASTTRHDVARGYVISSAGRVMTTVTRNMSYRNVDTITDNGLTQSVRQADTGTQTSTSTRARRTTSATRTSYDYPLAVDYSAANYVDDQNFSLDGTVDMTRRLAADVQRHGRWVQTYHGTENVSSYGILSRANGVTSESDGHSTSYFRGDDGNAASGGKHYEHYLASDHGIVTEDVVRR